MANDGNILLPDGSFDWSGGVDSSKITTLASELNPNGLGRQQLAWLNNATVRGGGILQRTGWQPLLKLIDSGRWQGGFIYEPDSANPYLVCSISGHIYKVLLEAPYTVTELINTIVAPWTGYGTNNLTIDGNAVTLENPQYNPDDAEMCWFVQGENYLVIQAGDYLTNPNPTLPLFWNGTVLRRSIGITTDAPSGALPGINEIPAATAMDYYGGRIWYAQARQVSGGDMVGGSSGNPPFGRDAIISVTENPLCVGGDGFTVPTNSGNIRAIEHSASLNASLGQGQLYIFTRKTIYMLTVPVNRYDWIILDGTNASGHTSPNMTVVQLVNGAVGDRCVVPINGDLFYQSFDLSIRTLMTAVRYFEQWGNTPISQNEQRALQFNDRSLMKFSSAIEFDNRILNLVLPVMAADGVNVVHSAVLPLDFDVVTNLEEKKSPVWEGAYDGLQFLQLFTGDFGGLNRAFALVISEIDGSINVWELTTAIRTDNGDNRITSAMETPAYTWATSGLEYKLKHLKGGEIWVDKVSGTVDFDIYYRVDADPCWRKWLHTSVCAARNCDETDPVRVCYPSETFCEGYKFNMVLPEPKAVCDSMQVRPTTIGYQFQIKIVWKGWCRIRGVIFYAEPHNKPQYHGLSCPPSAAPQGMAKLPNAFA